ncbi:gluconate transporter [Halarchaeum acidiphilum MH1-52-1]|uniref:Gluconate transporter n=1 Tax=Halarchaeum acidiphilum MH1-52-1 TaxID=1261545 RepID=U2YT82_9EURY|nr:SLC13 family permease [Halarchaeum acidiphilum]GAD52220.1 gluconate transporter [Halarchaeum acidiphilum MH1-52-1]
MVAALPPITAFAVGVAVVVLLLVVWDLPAFVGLVIAALLVGTTNAYFLPDVAFGNVPGNVATAFGNNMAGIGIPILMAAIIGKSMLESGAADRIVRSFRSTLSDENVDFALWGSSSFLAIPVFFDNVFYLMAPLARSMRARIGKNYALYLVVVGAGAATTHVFVPPTPGPLAVADQLSQGGQSILGTTIVVGLATAIPSALVAGIVYGRFLNARIDIPLRDAMGTSAEELEERAQRESDALPSFAESGLPIAAAIVLVASNTIVSSFGDAIPSCRTTRRSPPSSATRTSR